MDIPGGLQRHRRLCFLPGRADPGEKSEGKNLEKEEKAWYQRNRDIVDIRQRYSEEDNAILREWI